MFNNVGRLLSILYRKGIVFKNERLKSINLTASEYPFLCVLYGNDGVSQEYLSARLSIDKASTARVIQSLIKKGFVYREKDDCDKRAYKVFLTERGLEVRKSLIAELDRWNDILTSDMDEEEKVIAYSYLERMTANVEKYFMENGK